MVVSVLLTNANTSKKPVFKILFIQQSAIIPISSSGTTSCASLPDATSVSSITTEAEYEPKDGMKKSQPSSGTKYRVFRSRKFANVIHQHK